MVVFAFVIGIAIITILVWRLTSGSTTKEPANPLAEAEVYATYGRKAEAIKILSTALSSDPGNAEIHEKLEALRREKT